MIHFAVKFVAIYPGPSDEKRGTAVNRPPPGGELAPVVGEVTGRPGKNKRIVRVCWKLLTEYPVRRSLVLKEAGDIESEWAMFCASIVQAVPVMAATPTLTGALGIRRS